MKIKEKEKTENGGEELVEEKQEDEQVKEKGDPKTLTEKMLDLMERLPESDALQNGNGLLFEFPFGVVNVKKGEKLLMSATDAEARLAARAKHPRPPSAQIFLKQALDFQARLLADKKLKRAALAREVGITPTRLTQILRLLGLCPEVRRLVLALPSAVKRGPLERELRAIAQERDHEMQLQRFQKLLGVRR